MGPVQRWEVKAYPLFSTGCAMPLDKCLSELWEILERERELNQKRIEMSVWQPGRGQKGSRCINYYTFRWKLLVKLTSLNRKRKSLAANLIELIDNNSNACNPDEISKLANMSIILFESRDGLRDAMLTVASKQMVNCQERLYNAISIPLTLLGLEDTERVLQLNEMFRNHGWAKIGLNLTNFLLALEHPLLSSLEPRDKTSAFHTVEAVYLGEILEPCSKVCALGAGDNKTDLIKFFLRDAVDQRRLELDNINQVIQSACLIVSIDVGNMIEEILKNFKKIMRRG